jgi:transposase-like protein
MRYTKNQFDEEFPDDNACLDRMFKDRYGDVDTCPSCGVIGTKFYRVTGRKCYACEWCGYQLHPLAQTIFHKSSTSLRDWFYAIYLFSVGKNGVSAKEIERHLGVTYKTAHRMARQIRSLMSDDSPIGGKGKEVEIDETYIGGVKKGKPHLRYTNKSIVFGAVERDGRIRAKVVPTNGVKVLMPEVRHTIRRHSTVYSDELRAYVKMPKIYSHTSINHSKLEWARGKAHTNTIEGFWSQLKRSISGTYHAVSPKYLQLYVDEFAFRYSYRGVAVYPVLLERASRLS